MLYEVRVTEDRVEGLKNLGTFEHKTDKPLSIGDPITATGVSYEVVKVLPGHGKYDGVAEAARFAGPARFDRHAPAS